jgi:hypothetical protein
MSTGTELVMLLRGRAPLAVAMTASAQPNKVLTPRTTVARSKSGVSGRNIMYFIRGVSDHPTLYFFSRSDKFVPTGFTTSETLKLAMRSASSRRKLSAMAPSCPPR